ncbi:MAG: hypothetical protein HDT28_00720 [Clostridiales bacterium]|nr:hypothetical protein [Clostridiales bacterium]
MAERGMGWYKFLINFALPLGVVWNIAFGVIAVTGYAYKMYDVDPTLIYALYPGLQTVDIIYGVALFLLAAVGIAARFMLAKYMRLGPIALYALYFLVIVVEIVYAALVAHLTESSFIEAFSIQNIIWLVAQFVCLVVSFVYFRKRSDMFIH